MKNVHFIVQDLLNHQMSINLLATFVVWSRLDHHIEWKKLEETRVCPIFVQVFGRSDCRKHQRWAEKIEACELWFSVGWMMNQ